MVMPETMFNLAGSLPGFLMAADLNEILAGYGGTAWNILRVCIGLGFVIFVHELGHFLAAKFFGVKCEKFYVGFDVPIQIGPLKLPAKLFHFQWGETEYGIGSIPLGGYVKMLGQDDDPRKMEEENERIRVAGGNAEAVGPAQYDPRSFPAKNVFARMVIISAGVIMNILFGIVFAAVAYRIGVPYESTVVGEVLAGDPAWHAGMQSGDHIVQVADMKEPKKDLGFRRMREAIALAGFDQPKEPIPITLDRNGETVQLEVVGTTRHDPDKKTKIISIGMRPAISTKLSEKQVVRPEIATNWPKASEGLPKFKPGDTIVAINGKTLPLRSGLQQPLEHELNAILHPEFDQTVKVSVERVKRDTDGNPDKDGSTETVELEWKPLARRTLGIAFETGPVAAVKPKSIAEQAGVKVGDVIESLDGEPIEDAYTLPLAIAKKKGLDVVLKLQRVDKDGNPSEPYTLEWKVPETFVLQDSGLQFNPVGIELPGSGLVYAPSNMIASVEATAITAGKRSILPGEEVRIIRLDPENDDKILESIEKLLSSSEIKELLKGRELKDGYSSYYLHSLVQILPLGTKLKLDFMRDGVVTPAAFVVSQDNEWSWFDRGVVFQPARLIRRAEGFKQAVVMGCHEIVDKASEVVRFLRLLFTGKISLTQAGGPAMIFVAATNAASEGTTTLLMFLTMLSANLAVLNFLPIPALDGGHMMFLIAEAIRGKPVDENLQMRLTIAGVFALLALMVFVIFNDITHLSKWFG
jgi:regulator of sigma E protease